MPSHIPDLLEEQAIAQAMQQQELDIAALKLETLKKDMEQTNTYGH